MGDETGRIAVDGHEVWYRKVGTGTATPLLLLHGGPGAGSDYLESFEDLGVDRPVIFYDQLGCGRSDQPDDPSLWTMQRFVREVDVVREALELEQVHLLGQSWGGFLAIEYLLGQPSGVCSAVLANTASSVPQAVAEMDRLRRELPAETYATMLKYEALSDFHNPEYEGASLEFYLKHLIRSPEIPDAVMRSLANLDHNQVYEIMNGPNEYLITGSIKDWDRTEFLSQITIPALVVVGRYDELTPACAETINGGLPNSQLEVFENSAHLPHWEERDRYMELVGAFLKKVDLLSA